MIIRTSLVGLVIAAAVGIAACGGGGISQKEANQLQDRGAALQQKAQQISADVKSGKITAEEGAKQLQEDATNLADDSIDAANGSNLPDDVQKQLDEAKKQLDAANAGK
jgi:uncharacterized phage infection (PIP) family protein YhgE